MHLVKLKTRPGAQFHFGNRVSFENSALNSTDKYLHSDTLFSALVNVASKIGAANELVEEMNSTNRISSAFYMLENESNPPVYFLPRPTIPLTNCGSSFKLIKQKVFVSREVLEKGIEMCRWKELIGTEELIAGENWISTTNEIRNLLGNGFSFEKASEIRLFQFASIPQVCVHATVSENSYYQVGNLQIADNRAYFEKLQVHLYFLLSEKPSPLLNSVLELLVYEGLGGQRSTGCGQVLEVTHAEFAPFSESDNKCRFMALSKIAPSNDDMAVLEKNTCCYQATIRGGRTIDNTNSIRLKQLRMIDEGAIFEEYIDGKIVDLCPENINTPFLRYGRAFLYKIPKTICNA